MKKTFIGSIAGLALAFAPFIAMASTSAVGLAPVTTIGCGTQTVTVIGTANYGTLTSSLQIFANGTQFYDSTGATTSQPATFAIGTTVGAGTTTINAQVSDLGTVSATTSAAFSIAACPAVVHSATATSHRSGSHRRTVATATVSQNVVSQTVVNQLLAIFKAIGMTK